MSSFMHVGSVTSRRGAVAGAAAAVLAITLLTSSSASAEPDSLSAAKAKAKALAAQVQQLESQVEVAGEDLAAAQGELGGVVSRQISANQKLAELSTAAQESRTATNERIRALYMSGGQAGLYATVLDGGSLTDVLARVDAVGRVLDRDRSTEVAAGAAVADASALQSELSALATQQTQLEAKARTAETQVRSLLDERQRALDKAGSQVVALTEAWRQEQARAAAARAALQLGVSGPRPTTLPPTDTVAGTVLRAADSVLGVPYVYAGNGPSSFDCSGLTVWAYGHAGVQLPRTSRQQWWVGSHPSLGQLQPGDLLFWANNVNDPATIHHVALYVGNGWMIHAPHTGDVVRYAPMYLDGYIGATRPGT